MHDLTRSYRPQPPGRLGTESDDRQESFPEFARIQDSRLLHLLLQSKHGVPFVAAVSESYSDLFLPVFLRNVDSITSVRVFPRLPRLAFPSSLLIDVPSLAKLGLARFPHPKRFYALEIFSLCVERASDWGAREAYRNRSR